MDKKQVIAPGKSHQEGIDTVELLSLFKDEDTARRWFESIVWKNGKAVCHRCNGTNTYEVRNGKPLPHKCRDCRKHFSFRHGTIFEGSNIPLRKWAIAIYLVAENPDGISSMQLHRELNITQKSAWYMLRRIREALAQEDGLFYGEMEVDKVFVGGLDKNKHETRKPKQRRGAAGKTAVVDVKNRQ